MNKQPRGSIPFEFYPTVPSVDECRRYKANSFNCVHGCTASYDLSVPWLLRALGLSIPEINSDLSWQLRACMPHRIVENFSLNENHNFVAIPQISNTMSAAAVWEIAEGCENHAIILLYKGKGDRNRAANELVDYISKTTELIVTRRP